MKKHEFGSSPLSTGYLRRHIRSYLSVLAISTLLLTGCSTPTPESKPEYDEVELMTYNICLEKLVDELVNKGTWLLIDQYVDQAKIGCEAFMPVKK
jgi:hypothetical protein